jgi:hypothetical protein
MNDDIKRLRNLVDTYKLSRPVSPELQQLVIDSRSPDLRQILMKSGKYGVISWIVIMIFTLFRKYGIHITMIQSKIVAGITAAAVASGSAAVAYRGAKYVIDVTGRPVSKIDETIDKVETGITKQPENNTPDAPAQKNRIQEKNSFLIENRKVDTRKAAPAEKNDHDTGKSENKKKKGSEHNTFSDIPSL